MKDNRTFLAIVVSLVVMFLYFQVIAPMIVPKAPVKTQTPAPPADTTKHTCPVCCGDKYVAPEKTETPTDTGTTANTAKPPNGNAGTAGGGDATVTPAPESEFKHPEVPPQQFTLESATLRVVVTNVGAAAEAVFLKKFRSMRGEPELQLLQPLHETWRPFMVRDVTDRDAAHSVAWQVEPGLTGKMVSLTYTSPDGLKYTKTFELSDKPYLMRMELSIENLATRALDRQLLICTTAGIDVETEKTPSIRGLLARRDDNGLWRLDQELMLEKAAQKPSFDAIGTKMWTGVDNKYFAVVLVAENQSQAVRFGSVSFESFDVIDKTAAPGEKEKPKTKNILALVRTGMLCVAKTGDRITFNCPVFIGPKEEELLTGYSDVGLDRLLNYGTFEFISKILLAVLGAFFSIVKNYGVAIILLTIAIKLLLFPLTKRGQVSMNRMQKLQPQVMEIRKKYQKDWQKMNEEIRKLYAESGVNPLGGCFPLLLQLPVFIGLYRALDLSITLRQAPFFAWVQDLSQPDTLFRASGYDFHLLPILMTISWFIQTLLQPKAPDPQARAQQKMFVIMPIIFGILLYNMPSGLILYWLTSTALSIGEQFLIKRYFLK